MNLLKRIKGRGQRQAHERYLAERARQEALAQQDVEEAIRNVATRSGANQQGVYGHL
ncbi:MAG: hypothetical protein ACXVRV_12715 [Gaiellaceae bacterium]